MTSGTPSISAFGTSGAVDPDGAVGCRRLADHGAVGEPQVHRVGVRHHAQRLGVRREVLRRLHAVEVFAQLLLLSRELRLGDLERIDLVGALRHGDRKQHLGHDDHRDARDGDDRVGETRFRTSGDLGSRTEDAQAVDRRGAAPVRVGPAVHS